MKHTHPLSCRVARDSQPRLKAAAALLLTAMLSTQAHAIDAAAAEKLVNDNKCVKCHAVDRKKDGPAYRDVAAKFRPEADAVEKIKHHVSAGDMVKFPDGHEEHHKKVKVSSPEETENLARWILSLEGGTKY